MGGINFLKSDLFFLIFTTLIIFFEYFLYITYYSIKGPRKRIFTEKTADDLFIRRKRSSLLQKRLLFFFLIVSIIYISDNYVKIFLNILNQFIIIEFFLHFIFCFINGTIFFSLIMVTLDLKVLKDTIFIKKLNFKDKAKQVNNKNIFLMMIIFLLNLLIGSIFILIFKVWNY